MLIYIILFFLILLAAAFLYRSHMTSTMKNGIFLLFSGILLIVVSAIRYDVGIDYSYIYAPLYEQITSTGFTNMTESRHEIGYVLLEYLSSLFSVNFQTIFVVTSILCIGLFFFGFYKYSPNAAVSVLLFLTWGYFFCSMNFIRQSIASGILLFAIMFIKKQKPVAFLVLVLLAASFHKTALIMLPFYFILQIKITKKVLIVYGGVTAFLLAFSDDIINFIVVRFFPWYLGESAVFLDSSLSFTTVIMPLAVFIIFLLFSDLLCEDDSSNSIYLSTAFFMLFLHIMSLKHALLDRFVIFFAPVLMIGLAVLITGLMEQKAPMNSTHTPIVVTLVLCLVSLLTAASQMTLDGHGVIPYQTIFSQPFYQEYTSSLKQQGVQTEDGFFAAIAKPFRPNGFADLSAEGPETMPSTNDIPSTP